MMKSHMGVRSNGICSVFWEESTCVYVPDCFLLRNTDFLWRVPGSGYARDPADVKSCRFGYGFDGISDGGKLVCSSEL